MCDMMQLWLLETGEADSRQMYCCCAWDEMGGVPKCARMWLQVMTGPDLAKLVETMVGALNSREIPTAGSILEHFNADLVQKVRTAVYLSLLAIPQEVGIWNHAGE
jgi:hypothetical protein